MVLLHHNYLGQSHPKFICVNDNVPTTSEALSKQNGLGNVEATEGDLASKQKQVGAANERLGKAMTELLGQITGATPKVETDQQSKPGLSIEEARRKAEELGLQDILGTGDLSLARIVELAKRKEPYRIHGDYRMDALRNYKDYPRDGGVHACALTASTFMGLGKDNGSIAEKEWKASDLLAKTVRSNQLATGTEGFIIGGHEELQRGDLIAFKGVHYAPGKINHVATIRDRITIDGEEYIVIQHDEKHIQVDIVPVKKGANISSIQDILKDPVRRAEYIQRYPKLAEIYEFRKGFENTVRVKKNEGWFGSSASDEKGQVIFGVRTAGLITTEPETLASSTKK